MARCASVRRAPTSGSASRNGSTATLPAHCTHRRPLLRQHRDTDTSQRRPTGFPVFNSRLRLKLRSLCRVRICCRPISHRTVSSRPCRQLINRPCCPKRSNLRMKLRRRSRRRLRTPGALNASLPRLHSRPAHLSTNALDADGRALSLCSVHDTRHAVSLTKWSETRRFSCATRPHRHCAIPSNR